MLAGARTHSLSFQVADWLNADWLKVSACYSVVSYLLVSIVDWQRSYVFVSIDSGQTMGSTKWYKSLKLNYRRLSELEQSDDLIGRMFQFWNSRFDMSPAQSSSSPLVLLCPAPRTQTNGRGLRREKKCSARATRGSRPITRIPETRRPIYGVREKI